MPTRENIYANRYHDTTKRFQSFMKLMLVWKGSVFKLIWHNLLTYLVAYTLLSILYRTVFVHYDVTKDLFHAICITSSRFSKMIPITFLTGFYVTQVVTRYWNQFISLPWPDRLAQRLVAFIPGQTQYHRLLRRTVMRYINLSTVLVFRLVAAKVHARFPTYQSLVDSGLLLPGEADRLAVIDNITPHETTWTPIMWAVNLIQKERTEGRIKIEAPVYGALISSFDYIDNCNRQIFNYGWVNFPLAYTQVATLSVYLYLCASLFANQYLLPPASQQSDLFKSLDIHFSSTDPFKFHTPDIYIPVFAILEFIGYMGWIKVAETLLNPWGDDDEDFQINYVIDRNFQISYLIVDECLSDMPLEDDLYLNKTSPTELPYNEKDKNDDGCCEPIKKVLRRPLENTKYKRMHKCDSTRSRLRSLNQNRKARTGNSSSPPRRVTKTFRGDSLDSANHSDSESKGNFHSDNP